VSCQVDLLKPKINAAVIVEEANKPAKLTVTEARLRLQQSQVADERVAEETEQTQEQNNKDTAPTNTEKVTAKKTTRLGGIFDILLPSKLRNPVK